MGDASERGVRQRLLAAEDAHPRNAPVDAIGGRLPAHSPAMWLARVGELRPDDGQTIPTRDQVQALPRAVRAQVGVDHHTPLHLVAQGAQTFDEMPPIAPELTAIRHQVLVASRHQLTRLGHSEALLARDGVNQAVQRDHAPRGLVSLGHQRRPLQHLFDVFQGDDVGPDLAGPAVHDPRQ